MSPDHLMSCLESETERADDLSVRLSFAAPALEELDERLSDLLTEWEALKASGRLSQMPGRFRHLTDRVEALLRVYRSYREPIDRVIGKVRA